MNICHDTLSDLLFGEKYSDIKLNQSYTVDGILLVGVILAAYLAFFVIRRYVKKLVASSVSKTSNTVDNELFGGQILNWISMLIPILLVYKFAPDTMISLKQAAPSISSVITLSAEVSIIILLFLLVSSVLNAVERIYQRFEMSRELPIKGMTQVIKIIFLIAAIIFIISAVIGKSPLFLFSGLGAMTAILMLIFKDSILGLVAGIQLSANRMVARGDWIEMPKFGADGEVLDVALTTVKIRNWDKTITTIPTYSLISDSFKNWRGMSSSGVRRIKRHIYIDISTVSFLSDDDMVRMRGISVLKEYLSQKEQEVEEWNENNADPSNNVNARALSNIGTFRAYIDAYLNNHPKISKTDTRLVRQLQPTDHGLPIELYVFTNDNAWAAYESIQSDIMDHLLSILPEFKLRAFQRPSDASVINAITGGK